MKGQENLIPFNKLTEDEQRELARKGGKASVKARRERKTIAETMQKLLDDEVEGTGMTRREAIIFKALHRAYKQGKMDDVVKIAQLVGEFKQNLNVESDGMVCVVRTEEEAQKIADIKELVNKMKE